MPGGSASLTWALADRPRDARPAATRARAVRPARRPPDPRAAGRAASTGRSTTPRRLPGLALSVAALGRTATVWRLRLRPGVRFQDGARFNAAAVLANAERWLARAGRARGCSAELLVDAPRPDLVRFILPAPTRDFDRAARLAAARDRLAAGARAGGRRRARREPAARERHRPVRASRARAPAACCSRATPAGGAPSAGSGPGVDQIELASSPTRASAWRCCATAPSRSPTRRRARTAAVRADPLLTTSPGRAAPARDRALGARDPARDPAPSLNAVWLTGIDAAERPDPVGAVKRGTRSLDDYGNRTIPRRRRRDPSLRGQ